MAGIAVFPMPASSPAMSSLPLAVEHAHTDPWLALSTALHSCCPPLQNAQSARPRPFSSLNQSPSIRSHIQTQTQTNTQPRQAYYARIYNTSEAYLDNLLGAGRNHFFTSPLTSGLFHFARLFAQRRHVSTASSSCGYLRAFSIYRSIAKPQCWTV